jgi:hypothetical protein
MVKKIKHVFNTEIQSSTPINDFIFLLNSKNILLSVSSFSYTAAFLSSAEKIFFPRAGIFGIDSIDGHQLEVKNDPRFINIDVNTPHPWTGSPEQIEKLLNS